MPFSELSSVAFVYHARANSLIFSPYASNYSSLNSFFREFTNNRLSAHPGSVFDRPSSLYFANSGLQTRLNLLNTGKAWWTLLVLIVSASIAKIVPVTLVSKLCSRKPWFYCLSIGVLMNTRGIVQLVVLNIGVQLGVISPVIFAIFVLMATILTFLTSPILSLLYRKNYDVQKLSVPNMAQDLCSVREGSVDPDNAIPTISNGQVNPTPEKSPSVRSAKRSSINLPVHDAYVTFNEYVDYAGIDSNVGEQEADVDSTEPGDLSNTPRRFSRMTQF